MVVRFLQRPETHEPQLARSMSGWFYCANMERVDLDDCRLSGVQTFRER